jgi:hypothetical protein
MHKKIKEIYTLIILVPLQFFYAIFIYLPYYIFMKEYEKWRDKREKSKDSITLVI